MAFKDLVNCPLGERCPSKSKRHRSSSYTYQQHLAAANGKISIESLTQPATGDFAGGELEKSETGAFRREDGTVSFMGLGKGKPWKDAQKEINQAMISEIEEGISSIVTDPKELDRYLEFVREGYTYSMTNTLLLMRQKQGAGVFKTKQQWEALGYKVNFGAATASIRRPLIKTEVVTDDKGNVQYDANGEPKTKDHLIGYKFYGVFSDRDLDTEHKEPPMSPLVKHFHRYKHDDSIEPNIPLKEDLDAVAKQLGIEVHYKNKNNDESIASGSGGYAAVNVAGEKIIVIDEGSAPHAQVGTLAHEMGHILAGHLDKHEGSRVKKSTQDIEFEAEIFAYAVARNYGDDTGLRTFPYLKAWSSGKSEQVENALGVVTKSLKKYYEHLSKSVSGRTQSDVNAEANAINKKNYEKKKSKSKK